MVKGSSNSRINSRLPPSTHFPSLRQESTKANRAADSFLPFILPCAPAEGPPGEISLRQKKTMDILPGYTGSPGCGSLEGDRAGTGIQIPASLSDSSGPCQGRVRALILQAQTGGTVWPTGEPAKLDSGDTVRSNWARLESRSEFPPRGSEF